MDHTDHGVGMRTKLIPCCLSGALELELSASLRIAAKFDCDGEELWLVANNCNSILCHWTYPW